MLDADELDDIAITTGLRGSSTAPPVGEIARRAGRRRRRRRAFHAAAGITALLGVAVGGLTVTAERNGTEVLTTPAAEDRSAGTSQARRDPTQVKADVLDAVVATAPDLLTVVMREDNSLDRASNPELTGRVQFDFAHPEQLDLDEPPAGVKEWVNGDPGGGIRAIAFVTVSPDLDHDVAFAAFDEPVDLSARCGDCRAALRQRADSHVQFLLAKPGLQVSVAAERPEVWPEMAGWLDRLAAAVDRIAPLTGADTPAPAEPKGLGNTARAQSVTEAVADRLPEGMTLQRSEEYVLGDVKVVDATFANESGATVKVLVTEHNEPLQDAAVAPDGIDRRWTNDAGSYFTLRDVPDLGTQVIGTAQSGLTVNVISSSLPGQNVPAALDRSTTSTLAEALLSELQGS